MIFEIITFYTVGMVVTMFIMLAAIYTNRANADRIHVFVALFLSTFWVLAWPYIIYTQVIKPKGPKS